MTALNGFAVQPFWAFGGTPSTAILDASGDKIGSVCIAPKTGTIDRIALYCTATTGTAPSYTAQLESVSAGLPNGIIAANRSGTVTPTASTLHLVTLTTSYSVTVNELIACTLNAAGADGSNNATFNLRLNVVPAPGATQTYHNRAVQDLSVGTWSAQSIYPNVVPVYSDDTFFPLCVPRTLQTTTDYSSSSTPDEMGLRWTQVGAERSIGAYGYVRMLASGSSWKMKLYDVSLGDSGTPIAETTITQSVANRGTAEEGIFTVYWSSSVNLSDGSDYRLTMVPTSANQIRVLKLTYGSSPQRSIMSHYYYTSRTRTADGDAGSWTDDTSASMTALGIVKDQSNTTSSGGMLIHPGFSGGLRG